MTCLLTERTPAVDADTIIALLALAWTTYSDLRDDGPDNPPEADDELQP